MHTLEQVRGVIRAVQTSMMILLIKIDGSINLKALTILAKRLLLVVWLFPWRISSDGYNTVLKVQMKILKDGRWTKSNISSCLDRRYTFDHPFFDHPFFSCPIRRASKVVRPKSRAPSKKFVHSCPLSIRPSVTPIS